MSVQALTWSFGLELPDMAAKAALHALADHADESGRCWPSMQRVARWAGCNEKTARRAIQRLEVMGAVRREPRSGRTDMFTLVLTWQPARSEERQRKDIPVATRIRVYLRDGHRCVKCGQDSLDLLSLDHIAPWAAGGDDSIDNLQTMCIDCNKAKGANFDPSQEWEKEESGVVAESAPPRTLGPEPRTLSPETPPRSGSRTVKNRQKNHQGTVNEQHHQLPGDWRPSQACRDFASDLGLDPDAVAEAFVDYWTSDKGRRTKRADWDRTFRVWCRRDNTRPVGQGPARPVQPSRGGDAYLDQLALIASRAQADERDGS